MQLLHNTKLNAGQTSPPVMVEERTAAIVLLGGAQFVAIIEVSVDGQHWVPLTAVKLGGVYHVPQGCPYVRVMAYSGTVQVQIGTYGTTWQNLVSGVGGTQGNSVALGPRSFTELNDTPDDYTGHQGEYVAINPSGTGLSFVPAPVAPPSDFLGLTDTPDSFAGKSGYMVVVNAAGTGLDFIPVPTVNPPTTDPVKTPAPDLVLVKTNAAVNLTSTNGAKLVLNGTGTLSRATDGIVPGPPPVRHASADDYMSIGSVGTRLINPYGRGYFQFTENTLVGGVELTFGIQRHLWEDDTTDPDPGKQQLRESGYIPPSFIAVGYDDGSGNYIWSDPVAFTAANGTVRTARVTFAKGVLTKKITFDFWSTELVNQGTQKPSFALGEVKAIGPSTTAVTNLPVGYNVRLPSGELVKDPADIHLTESTRLSVVNAGGTERAAAFMSPGETWRYSE